MNTDNRLIKENTKIRIFSIYLSQNKIILLLILLGLIARLYIWTDFLINQPQNFIENDTPSYLYPGKSFLEHGTFPSFSRTPVYPIFLAVTGELLSFNPAVLALIQIFLSLATIWITYLVTLRVFNFANAAIATFFLAFDFHTALHANFLLSETLFTLLLSLCLLGVIKIYGNYNNFKSNFISMMILGVGFSILTLCRPIAVFLSAFIALWYFLVKKVNQKNLLFLLFCFLVVSFSLPMLWTTRNYAKTGEWFLTTLIATNLFEYRAAWNTSYVEGRPYEEVRSEFKQMALMVKEKDQLNEGQWAKWKQQEGIEILKKHPMVTLRQGVIGLFEMHFEAQNLKYLFVKLSDSAEKLEDVSFYSSLKAFFSPTTIIVLWRILHNVLLYLGIVFTFYYLVTNKVSEEHKHILYLLFIIVCYFTFFSVGIEAYVRFRVPIVPTLSILSAYGWTAICIKANNQNVALR